MQQFSVTSLRRMVSALSFIINTSFTGANGFSIANGSNKLIAAGRPLPGAVGPGDQIAFPNGLESTILAYSVVSGNAEYTLSIDSPADYSNAYVEFKGIALLHLASAPPSGDDLSDPAAFVEAAFDGYEPIALNADYTKARSAPDGSGRIECGPATWALAADAATPQQIYAYYVTFLAISPAVRTVLLWEELPAVRMALAGDAISLSVPVQLPTPGAATVVAG